MMEKLSANEFDINYDTVLAKYNAALSKVNKTSDDVVLLAATKTVDAHTIDYAYSKGIMYAGENKVQELLAKYDTLKKNHLHFIGHLQTNKVKDIIDKVELIHSVDSVKLAKEISKQAIKIGKVMDILIEVNVGGEESKWGFNPIDVESALKEIANLDGVKVRGLMTIPPICENEQQSREYFRNMNKLFIDIRAKKIDNVSMDILSMGMSDDFDIAIEEGATLVRVGTALFGKRNYNI